MSETFEFNPDDYFKHEDSEFYFTGLRKDNILHIFFKSKIIVDLKTQIELLKVYDRVSNSINTAYMIEGGDFIRLKKEAQRHVQERENELKHISLYVIVKNNAQRIIANFFYKFYKPNKPFKIVGSFDEAVQWSLNQRIQ